jgi:CO/xanthine dehydrogenase FAD-binding subunit
MKLYRPVNLIDALKVRSETDVIVLAGGTDLMVKYRNPALIMPEIKKDLLYIGHLKELKGITSEGGTIRIGAATTLDDLEENAITPSILKKAIKELASLSIRNVATIGGNIANASPAGDTISPLIAMDGSIILKSLKGERRLPINKFILGPGKTVLEHNEIIETIEIKDKKFNREYYKKVGTRLANALSKINFVGLAFIENDTLMDIRIAIGAVAPVVMKSEEIEKRLQGMKLKEIKKCIKDIQKEYSSLVKPIDDQRSNAIYRKNVTLNLLRNFLQNL